jgi:hypothetical protein
VPAPGTLDVQVADSRHTLFVHSFKGYGLNDAYDRAITLLLGEEVQQDRLAQKQKQQKQERERKQQERERERGQQQKQQVQQQQGQHSAGQVQGQQQQQQQQIGQQQQQQQVGQQQQIGQQQQQIGQQQQQIGQQQQQQQQIGQQQGEQQQQMGAALPSPPSLVAAKEALLAANIAANQQKLPVTEASSDAASQQVAAGNSHAAATLASAAAIATQQQAQQRHQQQEQQQLPQLQQQQSQQQQGKALEEGPRQLAAGQAQAQAERAEAEAQVQAEAQALSGGGRSLLLGLAQMDSAATAAAARQLLRSLSGPALDPRLEELEARLFGAPATASAGGRSLLASGSVLPLPTPSALPLVHHPCLFRGYNASYQRLPVHGQAPEPAAVQLVGEPNPERCLELARRVVNASTGCIKPPCTLGTPTPELSGQFTALTGFYVVWSFLKIRQGAPVGELLPASQAYCRKPWQEAHAGARAAGAVVRRVDSALPASPSAAQA